MSQVHIDSRLVHRFLPSVILAGLLVLAACTTAPSNEPAKEGKWNPQDFTQAVSLMKDGKYEKAAALLEGIAKVNDQLPGVYINLGIAYRKLGKFDEAEGALKVAIKRDPRSAVAFDELGLVERHLGKFPQARKAYEKSIDRSSGYTKAHLNLAILCDLYIGDNKCALKQYERYQRLTHATDKNVANWIIVLRRRMGLPIGKAKAEVKK
jgi:tetratricopeptide (TPR) repeat protein